MDLSPGRRSAPRTFLAGRKSTFSFTGIQISLSIQLPYDLGKYFCVTTRLGTTWIFACHSHCVTRSTQGACVRKEASFRSRFRHPAGFSSFQINSQVVTYALSGGRFLDQYLCRRRVLAGTGPSQVPERPRTSGLVTPYVFSLALFSFHNPLPTPSPARAACKYP